MTVTSLRAQENVEDSRWETAVRCIKKYEGWHGPEHHPYVAYGHRIRKGEKFPARLTESEGDSILRKDLKEMCALFVSDCSTTSCVFDFLLRCTPL